MSPFFYNMGMKAKNNFPKKELKKKEKKKCDDTKRDKDALIRHVISYVIGDEKDEESGLSHLAHAVCNCLFLMWFDKQKENKENEL